MSKNKEPVILFILTAVLIWLGVLSLTIGASVCGGESIEMLGQIGDSFGIITSLFTGFALVGTAYALTIQSKQREDFIKISQDNISHNIRTLRLSKIEALLSTARKLRKDLIVIVEKAKSNREFVLVEEIIKIRDISTELDNIITIYFAEYSPRHSIIEEHLGKVLDCIKDRVENNGAEFQARRQSTSNLLRSFKDLHSALVDFFEFVTKDNESILDIKIK